MTTLVNAPRIPIIASRRTQMASNYTPCRLAVIASVALMSGFVHAGTAAAQSPTRFATSCVAYGVAGQNSAECSVTVPAGKRFVIETGTVGGSHPSSQYVRVRLFFKVAGITQALDVPAGSQVLSNSWTWWSGALPGKVVADAGPIKLDYFRGSGTSGIPWFRVSLTGYLEDI
jgi:hypothetical protein